MSPLLQVMARYSLFTFAGCVTVCCATGVAIQKRKLLVKHTQGTYDDVRWYFWWFRNPANQFIGSLSHYLQGFIHPRWLFGISEPSRVSSQIVVHRMECQLFFHLSHVGETSNFDIRWLRIRRIFCWTTWFLPYTMLLCFTTSSRNISPTICSIKMKAGEKPIGTALTQKYEVNQVGNWRATLPHSHHTLEEKDWHSSWNSDGRKQCPEKKHHLVRLAWHPTCHSRLHPMVDTMQTDRRIEDVKRRSWSFRTQVSIASCNRFLFEPWCVSAHWIADLWKGEGAGRCNMGKSWKWVASCSSERREYAACLFYRDDRCFIMTEQEAKYLKPFSHNPEPSKKPGCCLYRRQLSRVFQ